MHNLVFAIFLKNSISVSFLVVNFSLWEPTMIAKPLTKPKVKVWVRAIIVLTMNNIKERLNEIFKKTLIFSILSTKEQTFYF